ncbi:FMN-binding glutamate synthase family protein [Marinicauda algicola]|uniref:FMN-binding glutamate synthase family protein n=1 Tax=Marinicauda algicola TaxID=2029849 RepID=A0A4S2GYU3_9PROT|nr:FMN-binding glutamate synthase family protein [Marinicauda algicola]TGY88138.1 FMN-binding glutamate synthase family protein [Marinicauda algicola]
MTLRDKSRYLPWLAAILLAALSIAATIAWSGWWMIGVVFFGTGALLGLFDQFQAAHTLWRNYPALARIRWVSEALRPFVRSYFVESETDGRPFHQEERALVYRRSKNIEGLEPFGSKSDFRYTEIEWIQHSIAARTGENAKRRLTIGGSDCKQPYDASIFNVSAMSFGAIGARATEALNKGAKAGNFAQDTGEGGISRHHRHGGDLIWEIGSGYFGCRTKDGGFDPQKFQDRASSDQVKMIEIKLSQGAKPGHGGVLPGEKVTQEIAEARGVPAGQDCISPPSHSAFSNPIEMMEFIARLRELSGGKPVGFKLCVGKRSEMLALAKAMLETKILPDFIVVDGIEGGTGAAPTEFIDDIGSPMRNGLLVVRDALTGTGLRERVKIGAAGKIITGARFAKTLALGADWVNSARGFMFALGCVQSMRCHTNRCPTGITTQDRDRQRGLVIEDKVPRVVNFHRNTIDALIQVCAAAGCEDPKDIHPEQIMRRWGADKASAFSELYPVLEPGQLLDEPEATIYAEEWKAARADSFDPRFKAA